MELKVDLSIKKKISSLLDDELLFNNSFTSVNSSDDGLFVVKDTYSKFIEVLSADAGTFNLDVLSSMGISPSDLSFIHLYCFNSTEGVKEIPDPVQFTLNITDGSNTISMGSVSQYQSGVVSGLLAGYDLNISNPVIATGKKAVLGIIIGTK